MKISNYDYLEVRQPAKHLQENQWKHFESAGGHACSTESKINSLVGFIKTQRKAIEISQTLFSYSATVHLQIAQAQEEVNIISSFLKQITFSSCVFFLYYIFS